jgi:hypothetical protein
LSANRIKCSQQMINLGNVDPFDYKFTIIKKFTIWIQQMLMKQVWSLQFITLEANWREIICQLLFLIQILTWRDCIWYLKLLYTWSKERKGVEEFWLDIQNI